MKNAVLLHGTAGSSNSNWLQWLKTELTARGYDVWVPDLPSAEYPSLREWTTYITANCPFDVNEDTLLVGHSAGAVAVLILAQVYKKVGKIISVAAFKDLNYLHEKLDWHANDRFFDVPFNFIVIKKSCQDIVYIHSDDDPYCPLGHAQYFAGQTNGALRIIPNQGHFNTEKGPQFRQLPLLLNYI